MAAASSFQGSQPMSVSSGWRSAGLSSDLLRVKMHGRAVSQTVIAEPEYT
jgi:hypothetical protein